jgi:hypothetical protein
VHWVAVDFVVVVEEGLLVELERFEVFFVPLTSDDGLQTEHDVYPSSRAFCKVISFLEYLRYLQLSLWYFSPVLVV